VGDPFQARIVERSAAFVALFLLLAARGCMKWCAAPIVRRRARRAASFRWHKRGPP
jgi:hypothetical protein